MNNRSKEGRTASPAQPNMEDAVKMRLGSLVLALYTLLLVPPAFAQEQTGSIQGVVKDWSGAVYPRRDRSSQESSVVGASTTITDSQGNYRFPALPPGTYTVTATLTGFTAAKVENTIVVLGQLLTIPLTLNPAQVTESVNVTAESPIIDVKQNATFATVGQLLIDRIPKGRDSSSVIAMSPGSDLEARAGGVSIGGASGGENRFIIDGIDTTNLQNGSSGKSVVTDFVQEVQVKTSGYNAEFPGATGGVVNAVAEVGQQRVPYGRRHVLHQQRVAQGRGAPDSAGGSDKRKPVRGREVPAGRHPNLATGARGERPGRAEQGLVLRRVRPRSHAHDENRDVPDAAHERGACDAELHAGHAGRPGECDRHVADRERSASEVHLWADVESEPRVASPASSRTAGAPRTRTRTTACRATTPGTTPFPACSTGCCGPTGS